MFRKKKKKKGDRVIYGGFPLMARRSWAMSLVLKSQWASLKLGECLTNIEYLDTFFSDVSVEFFVIPNLIGEE